MNIRKFVQKPSIDNNNKYGTGNWHPASPDPKRGSFYTDVNESFTLVEVQA